MRRRSFGLLVVGLAVAGLSCGGVREERLPDSGNTLQGKVTYGGQPLQFAAVVITAPGFTGGATLKEDGTYLAGNLPLGEVKVGVDTDAARGDFQSVMMAAAYKGPESGGKNKVVPKFVSVPAKYADPDTSGFKATIKQGENTFDIDIPRSADDGKKK